MCPVKLATVNGIGTFFTNTPGSNIGNCAFFVFGTNTYRGNRIISCKTGISEVTHGRIISGDFSGSYSISTKRYIICIFRFGISPQGNTIIGSNFRTITYCHGIGQCGHAAKIDRFLPGRNTVSLTARIHRSQRC